MAWKINALTNNGEKQLLIEGTPNDDPIRINDLALNMLEAMGYNLVDIQHIQTDYQDPTN